MNDIKAVLSSALSFDGENQNSLAFYKYLEGINLIAKELYQNAVFDKQSSFFSHKHATRLAHLARQSLDRIEYLMGSTLKRGQPSELGFVGQTTLEERINLLGLTSEGTAGVETSSERDTTPSQVSDIQRPGFRSIGRTTSHHKVSIPQTVPHSMTGGATIDVAADELFANTMLFIRAENEPLQKTKNGLPLSPLILEQQEATENLRLSKQKLELLRSMDNSSFDSSLHYLANVRRFDENVRMLSHKKETLDQKVMKSSSIAILSLDPTEIAVQLTLLQFSYLKRIQKDEFDAAVHPETRNATLEAPNLMGLIDFDDYVCRWVQTEILVSLDLKNRCAILTHFVRVAKACHLKKNFDIVKIIIKALQNYPVRRLHQTWKELLKPTLTIFKELELLFCSNDSNETIRRHIQCADPPFMPLLELILQDLKVSNDVSTHKLNDLSTSTGQNVDQIFNFIEYLQNHIEEFNQKSDLLIQHYILTRDVLSDNELLKLSFLRESRRPNEEPWQTVQVEALVSQAQSNDHFSDAVSSPSGSTGTLRESRWKTASDNQSNSQTSPYHYSLPKKSSNYNYQSSGSPEVASKMIPSPKLDRILSSEVVTDSKASMNYVSLSGDSPTCSGNTLGFSKEFYNNFELTSLERFSWSRESPQQRPLLPDELIPLDESSNEESLLYSPLEERLSLDWMGNKGDLLGFDTTNETPAIVDGSLGRDSANFTLREDNSFLSEQRRIHSVETNSSFSSRPPRGDRDFVRESWHDQSIKDDVTINTMNQDTGKHEFGAFKESKDSLMDDDNTHNVANYSQESAKDPLSFAIFKNLDSFRISSSSEEFCRDKSFSTPTSSTNLSESINIRSMETRKSPDTREIFEQELKMGPPGSYADDQNRTYENEEFYNDNNENDNNNDDGDYDNDYNDYDNDTP